MSDPSPANPDPKPDPQGEAIPLEPIAPPTPAPPHKPNARPSVLQLIDDKCPNCAAKMDADAVVCMSCGYDLKANEVLRPQTGVDVIEPPPVKPEFVKPGVKPATLVIAGGVVVLAAMIAAGVNVKPGGAMGTPFFFALLILYRAILHTGTGLAGLWCAAKFVDHRLNHVDLAAARMFLALGAFMLVWALRIPIENSFLEHIIRIPAAAAAYWLTLFALFRRNRQETTLIALFHVGAMMFVELGLQLAIWLETSVAPAPGH